jgi:hypothetical protein
MKRFLFAVAWLAVMAGNPILAKGGTNMHEMASSRHDDDPGTTGAIGFGGCGRGRHRDYHTHRCVGPTGFWR